MCIVAMEYGAGHQIDLPCTLENPAMMDDDYISLLELNF